MNIVTIAIKWLHSPARTRLSLSPESYSSISVNRINIDRKHYPVLGRELSEIFQIWDVNGKYRLAKPFFLIFINKKEPWGRMFVKLKLIASRANIILWLYVTDKIIRTFLKKKNQKSVWTIRDEHFAIKMKGMHDCYITYFLWLPHYLVLLFLC